MPAKGADVVACVALGTTLGSLVGEWGGGGGGGGGGEQLSSGPLGPHGHSGPPQPPPSGPPHGHHISRELRFDGLDSPGQPLSPLRESLRESLRDPLRDRAPPQATEGGPNSLSTHQQQQHAQQLINSKLELLVDLHGDMNDRQSQSEYDIDSCLKKNKFEWKISSSKPV